MSHPFPAQVGGCTVGLAMNFVDASNRAAAAAALDLVPGGAALRAQLLLLDDAEDEDVGHASWAAFKARRRRRAPLTRKRPRDDSSS